MIQYKLSPPVSNEQLKELFENAWEGAFPFDYVENRLVNSHWVCAFDGTKMIGFVKVITDGGLHGFVLDTTTHTAYQNQGIGLELLSQIAAASKTLGVKWLHADFEPHLTPFYRKAGYVHSEAGLLDLDK